MGIEPIEGVTQVIAFNDAIIYLDVTEDGIPRMMVELFEVDYIDDEIRDMLSEDLEEYRVSKQSKPKTQAKLQLENSLKQIVDEMLDEYNDKMALYMQFGNSEYYERCQQIMTELKKIQL